MLENRVVVLGIAEGGTGSFTPKTNCIVGQADVLAGGKRLLSMWPEYNPEKITIGSNLEEVADLIEHRLRRGKRVVVLASGDPDFFGIARFLIKRLGKENIIIEPSVSSMQLAFALIKESWEDAAFASVHGRPLEDIIPVVNSNHKVAILTDEENSPSAIARLLIERGMAGFRAYVCEDLGRPGERVIETDLESLAGIQTSPLNVLVLIREEQSQRAVLGIDDSEFARQEAHQGLITKKEVRMVSLGALALRADSVVWDLGAGTGSVAIEAAHLAHLGTVFAVEKDPARTEDIRCNARYLAAPNVTAIAGRAEEAIDSLPDPDAIFIGGSGGEMKTILQKCARRLRPSGRIVINLVTLENLNAAISELKRLRFEVDVTQVMVSRSSEIAGMTRFEPLDPVFVVSAWRREDD